MRIAVVHNNVSAESAPDELDVLAQADAVSEALRHLDHQPVRLSCNLNLAATENDLRAINPRLVFNLVESLEGSGRLVHLFPSLLEKMGLAYTGSGADALLLTSNKLLAKTLMAAAGLPTPSFFALDEVYRPRILAKPRIDHPDQRWIIKSVWEHASLGLDEESIVGPLPDEQLGGLLQVRARSLGGSCFAEHFIAGREFNLSLLELAGGVSVLPPAEILFEDFDDSQPKIVGYQAKWEEQSYPYHHTPRRFDFEAEDESLLAELHRQALACWHLFGLRGYARVDFRVDRHNRPWILEVNANPCLSADAGFAAAVHRSDRSYTESIAHIIAAGRPMPRSL